MGRGKGEFFFGIPENREIAFLKVDQAGGKQTFNPVALVFEEGAELVSNILIEQSKVASWKPYARGGRKQIHG